MPAKSDVWKYFEKRDKDNVFAKCKLCPKIIKTSGNTTNLKCHLRSMHKLLFEQKNQSLSNRSQRPMSPAESVDSDASAETTTASVSSLQDIVQSQSDSEMTDLPGPSRGRSFESGSSSSMAYKRQKSIAESFSEILSYKEGGNRDNKITNAILFMICRDYQPISIVEDEGFQNLLKASAPLYKIPCRRTVTKLLDDKYAAVSSLYKAKMAELENYSLTTDIWTDTMNSRSFLGLTIHFADENNKIAGVNLGVIELSERHTAEYLMSEINKLVKYWNLKHQNATAVVSDGAANITKAIQTIFGKNIHLHCFAHQLNLVAERALSCNEELKLIIKKVKNIVTWFKQSNNASDELRKSQQPNQIKKFIQECPTRWNSTYFMVQRFLELREISNLILSRHETAPEGISAREANHLLEIQNLLKPLEAASREIGGESYTTTSLVIPMIFNLRNAVSNLTPVHEIGKALKLAILTECERRFSSAEKVYILATATLLDPRFKKIYFRDALNCAGAVQKIQDLIKESVENIINENEHATHQNEIDSSETGSTKSFNLWAGHQRLVSEMQKNMDTSDVMVSEISLYLRNPVISLEENPIAWWARMAGTYPTLCKIARKLLSTVATSVPAERLFSKAGQTSTQKRNRLKGKRLSALLFLHSVDRSFWELKH